MQVNPSIFKVYDIRDIYLTDLNPIAAYLIWGAFITFLKANRVIVGRDMRLSGPTPGAEVTRGRSFNALTVIEGKAWFSSADERLSIGRFESLIVPAATGPYRLEPEDGFRALQSSL